MAAHNHLPRRVILGAAGVLAVPAVLRAQPAPVKLGILQPVTGALAQDGELGRLGAQIAVDELNAAGGLKALGGARIEVVFGDARSNHGDLALDVVRDLAATARHAHWLNPERRRSWDTGDSAASAYGAVVPMVECRNLGQLTEFVHDLAR